VEPATLTNGADSTATHNRLLLTGSLSLTGPNGERLQLRGAGERLEVDVDPAALSLGVLSRPPSRATRRRWLLAAQPALRRAGVFVEIRMNGRPVAFYAWHSKATLIARVLGLGPVEVRLSQLLSAWLRRAPVHADQ
jgi:hypothetical protein